MSRYAMLAVVGRSSVSCSSHGHISKTKQDTPIVTVEHSYEVGIADSVASFRSFPDAPPIPGGDIRVSYTKYVQILKQLLFDLASDHSCCKLSVTVINCYKRSATLRSC